MRQETKNEYEKIVNKAIDYINKNLYTFPDLKEIASEVNMSEFHFHRIFKHMIGENVGEFVARVRMQDITQRLRLRKDSLDTIAMKTSYADKYALSKAFKKHFLYLCNYRWQYKAIGGNRSQSNRWRTVCLLRSQ